MKFKMIIVITAALLVLIGLSAGIRLASANVTDKETIPEQYPRSQTLYIGGIYWGTPSNFNPLNDASAWPESGNFLLIYETLFAYNQLTNDLDPLLASHYEFAPDSSVVTVTLQNGTMWQDDIPLTAEDVKYTFEHAVSNPVWPEEISMYISGINIAGSRTLIFTLNPAQLNPGMVKKILSRVKILPMHIWQPRQGEGDIYAYVETHPIGSGPYTLQNFSPESIILSRDDSYWGKAEFGLPVPKYVIHRIYATNDQGFQAFANGELDMNQQFIPEIWKLWEEQGLPIGTWLDQPPYQLPASIPMLIINTTKPGLDNPLVRRALAYSIDYSAISQAVWGYTVPVSSSLIVPYGGENALFNPEQIEQFGWEYDPAASEDILVNQLGATKDPDGIYRLPDNTRLGPWSTRCPNGWLDWQWAITTTVESAHAAGIDLYTDFPAWDYANYYGDLQTGDFDLVMFWTESSGLNTPWQRFRDLIDPRDVPPPPGSANWNFGRFIDLDVPPLLDQVAQAEDPITVKDIYDQLDKIFVDNAPGIPLMYRPFEFYEFNTSHWLGFPTAVDPSAPPMFSGAGIEILYKITPGLFYLPVVTR